MAIDCQSGLLVGGCILCFLVGKVKMHCIYTQRLLIEFNVLHTFQRSPERPVPLEAIQRTICKKSAYARDRDSNSGSASQRQGEQYEYNNIPVKKLTMMLDWHVSTSE